MVGSSSVGSLCHVCSKSLFSELRNHSRIASRARPVRQQCHNLGTRRVQTFYSTNWQQGNSNIIIKDTEDSLPFSGEEARLLAEANARVARTIHGDTLPEGLLSAQEYSVYERLYGPPTLIVKPSRETVENEKQPAQPIDSVAQDERDLRHIADKTDTLHAEQTRLYDADGPGIEDDAEEALLEEDEASVSVDDQLRELERQQAADELGFMDNEQESTQRSHPWTIEGQFGTTPSTIFFPKTTFVDPISDVLSKAPNKHLQETALNTFGGRNFPNSVATPPSRSQVLHQKPIAITAEQSSMEPIESYAFVAANMSGIYATLMSTLTETRRRLGSSWLERLLNRPGGPRILDAGGAGAGVLAWRDILRAEWERLHPDASPTDAPPMGKSTVVVGSNELRERISDLLHDTTFLPRLPDFNRPRDLPGYSTFDPGARKHYDVIVAPHSLWHLKEDYMRKLQVQNLWSLLDPNGGVLVIAEKGVPRGFELVAGARDMLLQTHISSPGASHVETSTAEAKTERHIEKETGMIVAPCTNHERCPMYATPGEMKGRKDYCNFAQRFARPAYLQTLHGGAFGGRNHEDVRFSYVVAQRGVDLRQAQQEQNLSGGLATSLPLQLAQDEAATLTALKGYELSPSPPPMLSLPRVLLPPLKRHKHVTFDLCTPSAQLERWTVPKSLSKQAYRDARKAQWGDLWALGAKTRVLREPRVGVPKDDPTPRKRVIEIAVGGREEEDTIRELNPGTDRSGKRKGKKGRKEGRVRSRTLTARDLEEFE